MGYPGRWAIDHSEISAAAKRLRTETRVIQALPQFNEPVVTPRPSFSPLTTAEEERPSLPLVTLSQQTAVVSRPLPISLPPVTPSQQTSTSLETPQVQQFSSRQSSISLPLPAPQQQLLDLFSPLEPQSSSPFEERPGEDRPSPFLSSTAMPFHDRQTRQSTAYAEEPDSRIDSHSAPGGSGAHRSNDVRNERAAAAATEEIERPELDDARARDKRPMRDREANSPAQLSMTQDDLDALLARTTERARHDARLIFREELAATGAPVVDRERDRDERRQRRAEAELQAKHAARLRNARLPTDGIERRGGDSSSDSAPESRRSKHTKRRASPRSRHRRRDETPSDPSSSDSEPEPRSRPHRRHHRARRHHGRTRRSPSNSSYSSDHDSEEKPRTPNSLAEPRTLSRLAEPRTRSLSAESSCNRCAESNSALACRHRPRHYNNPRPNRSHSRATGLLSLLALSSSSTSDCASKHTTPRPRATCSSLAS